MGTIFTTLCMVMDLPILKLAPLMFSASKLQTHSDPFTLDRLIGGTHGARQEGSERKGKKRQGKTGWQGRAGMD